MSAKPGPTRKIRLADIAIAGVAVAGVLEAGIVAGVSIWAALPVAHAGCPAEGTLVQVDTRARILSLCRAGREDASFRVALGSGGVDKRVEGDARTPRGRYSLSPARRSADYHLFLAVGYPTPEQARRGYTGGAIGIHGPPDWDEWPGRVSVWSDWTRGCIALGTRDEVEQVARWVGAHYVGEVLIR
jgi:hypothetical protein